MVVKVGPKLRYLLEKRFDFRIHGASFLVSRYLFVSSVKIAIGAALVDTMTAATPDISAFDASAEDANAIAHRVRSCANHRR